MSLVRNMEQTSLSEEYVYAMAARMEGMSIRDQWGYLYWLKEEVTTEEVKRREARQNIIQHSSHQ